MPMSSISTEDFTTFGELLKHLRRRARLTQQELGLAVGYSESYITRLERDARLPLPDMVKSRFIDALNLKHDPELARRLIELAEATREQAGQPLATSRHSNLPMQLTRFIGRAHELTEINRLVDANRLVTLTGSGGVGKTRLALEAATALLEQFGDGVWLVELASLADSKLVLQSVARALGCPNLLLGAPTDALCAYLADKHALLLVDNCEHLIQACADLVETLLRSCAQLHVLATSREALNIPGEMAWRVPPMEADETVQLFVDRAVAVKPGFALSCQNAAMIANIGKQLDGIPLAIELAASRLSGLSVEQLAIRLRDRFRLLTDGSRTALPRHRTLHALIDWSHDLLSDQERILLRRLAVFSGGWTSEAAERVCATPHSDDQGLPNLVAPNILPFLLNLLSKFLIVTDEQEGELRYRLLETIREYAWEQLAACNEVEITRQQHAHYYLAYVQESAPRVMRETQSPLQFVLGAESEPWVKKLEQDSDNLRAALVWCLREAHDIETGIQLVLWLCVFWDVRGLHTEAIEWLRRALIYSDVATHALAHAQLLTAVAHTASVIGDYAWAETASIKALTLCRRLDNRFELMRALWVRTSEIMHRGHYAEARVLAEEWLLLTRELHNAWYEGIALFWLGIISMHQNDFTQALSLHEESLRVMPTVEIGTKFVVQFYQAMVWWCLGEDDRAMLCCGEGLAYFREIGFEFGTATVLHTMGDIVLFQGDLDRAKQYYLESVTLLRRQSARQRIVWPLAGLAALAVAEGQSTRAITLWAAADALREAVNSIDFTMSHDGYLLRINAARAELDVQTLAAAEAAGRALSFDQAAAYALQL